MTSNTSLLNKTPEGLLNTLDDKSPLPLYHRLYVLLREQIISGSYRNGESLPPENDLVQNFGVSRITVRRALNDLAAEGLITRARGRGTQVTYSENTAIMGRPVIASIDGLMANLSIIGHNTSVEVKTLDYTPAIAPIAEQLNVEPGTIIQHVTRVRYLKNEPFSHSQSYLLEDIGRSFTRDDLVNHALVVLIQKAGITIEHVQQAITCTLADEQAARLLKTSIGAPLLKLRRLFIDSDERPINYSEILYTPDRFEYRMNWSRGTSNNLELAQDFQR